MEHGDPFPGEGRGPDGKATGWVRFDSSASNWAPAFAGELLRSARRALSAIVAYALPPRCPGCGMVVQADHSFCLPCWRALDFLGGPACSVCAQPLELAFHADARCGACLGDPPPFDAMRAAVAYGPIARALALKLKYGRRPGIAVTMARHMRRAGGSALEGALVVPVPLHRRRLWTRGYNQAALIARALVRERLGGLGALREDLALHILHRRRNTPILRQMGPLARARAVQGAFAIDAKDKARVRGREVVLVDDVYTTGATAKACAQVLKRAGAARVTILCWARVVRDEEEVR